MTIEEFDYILYHSPCYDGAASGWIAQKWADENKVKVQILGYPYNTKECPSFVDGQHILFLDLTFEPKVMEELIRRAKKVTVIDHHKTANESELIKTKTNFIFDLDRSGAQLTWDYFFPGKKRPEIVDYIGDRDLWRFQLPESKAVNAVILASNPSLVDIEILYQHWNLDKFIRDGKELLRQQQMVLEELAKKFTRATLFFNQKMYNVLAGECDGAFRSDLGDFLNNRYNIDFVVLYSKTFNERYSVSFRGKDKVDCSAIAKQFGGGGHFNAAACVVDSLNFLSFVRN